MKQRIADCRQAVPAAALGLTVLLAGCGTPPLTGEDGLVRDRSTDYKAAKAGSRLEIPPDLTSSSIDDALVVPDINPRSTATYSQYSAERTPGTSTSRPQAVLPENPDIRVLRDGDRRWLSIGADADSVWPRVRNFWLEAGFLLKRDDPQAGVMETDWAENRADIPSGVIRDFLGKFMDPAYSAATRDMFRVRLERSADNASTELYLTHLGVEEVVPGGDRLGTSTVWQRRPREPDLEYAMLNRLMVYLGKDEQETRALLAEAAAAQQQPPRARLTQDGSGVTALVLEDDFSRAWRRTGIALDRAGFTVEDRDRSRGIYFVRYIDPLADSQEEGLLSKLAFWSDDEDEAKRGEHYLLRLMSREQGTSVTVVDDEGQPVQTETAGRILTLLHEQLE